MDSVVTFPYYAAMNHVLSYVASPTNQICTKWTQKLVGNTQYSIVTMHQKPEEKVRDALIGSRTMSLNGVM